MARRRLIQSLIEKISRNRNAELPLVYCRCSTCGHSAGLMEEPLFEPFRLVGGTALSLQLGHRKSIDIDLFTDVGYDEIDFETLDQWLRQRYKYVSNPTPGPIGFGRSYAIGSNAEEAIKLDIFHTDPFIRPALAIVKNISTITTKQSSEPT
jgi:Nucleotidyl transferase AbiEii toxin, Type IV TA system